MLFRSRYCRKRRCGWRWKESDLDYKDYASIPIANNIATANFLICSTLVNEQYSHQIVKLKNTVDVRVKDMQ